MSTVIRPKISKSNPYYISIHRYYELKHYCMQYKEWKREYNELCSYVHTGPIDISSENHLKDCKRDYERQKYLEKISQVEDSAKLTDEIIGPYILKGVTEGLPYSWMKVNTKIPCGKDMYYELYRKFFYILSHRKDA